MASTRYVMRKCRPANEKAASEKAARTRMREVWMRNTDLHTKEVVYNIARLLHHGYSAHTVVQSLQNKGPV